jgi:inosose dehydratase
MPPSSPRSAAVPSVHAERTGEARRVAAAPISWGVCEVPGWGLQLEPGRVLAEMRALGLTATELGPTGYLGTTAAEIRARLEEHGLELVGGFVPLVLHEADRAQTHEEARAIAMTLSGAGADRFVAAVVLDAGWSTPRPLQPDEWRNLVDGLAEVEQIADEEGLTMVLHPHVGTLVERAADVERVLADSRVPWCLDTGHLLIGGFDPVDFVNRYGDRVAHVHLKDVDARVASRLQAGELSLVAATQEGLFRPLGQGDARIDEVLRGLEEHGYEGWLVLEQDTAITGQEPPAGRGPMDDVRASIAYLESLAPQEEETPR